MTARDAAQNVGSQPAIMLSGRRNGGKLKNARAQRYSLERRANPPFAKCAKDGAPRVGAGVKGGPPALERWESVLNAYPLGNHLPLTFDKRQEILLSNVEGKMAQSTDLLQGTLDMLILKTLAPGKEHGWAIAQRIQEMSNNVLQIGQGSLYPALHRLEYRGWIRATWGASENNRRARFYALTAAGRKQLDAELENWDRLTGAVNLVLQGI
jgi:PadR family transcriptional regulator, regulatory protein PadR